MTSAVGTDGRVRPVAVIDIGSNSIRLVVYERGNRVPIPVFNEKVLCGLGRELDETGKLSQDGVDQALVALPRFVEIARTMRVERLEMLATAAVREAGNGDDFVRKVEQLTGHKVEIVTGEEEARLSGCGVLSGAPDADGVMGDLGGGSVELVHIFGGRTGEQATLPLGPLRLDPKMRSKPARARDMVDLYLSELGWLDILQGRSFYAVGGAWRAVAKLHMVHVDYPLHVIHHYRMDGAQALDFTRFVSRLSPDTLSKVHGINKRRVETLPYAALLLNRIMTRVQPSELVFSAYGLREGALFDRLPENIQREDPLLFACRQFAAYESSSVVDGDRLHQWIAPLFKNHDPREDRLRHAACLMSDIARWEHPDYRAEHALMRVLRFPFVGIDHPGRAFVGLAVASRHSLPSEGVSAMDTVNALIDPDAQTRARATGLAIRFAYTVSGGMNALLNRYALALEDDCIVLTGPEGDRVVMGEAVERRLSSLAKTLGLKYRIVTL